MRLQQKTVMQKTALLVRAGMMEPPKWYAAAKQVPPFHRRPSNGLETLKLPWDGLAADFSDRNPHMVEDSEWLGPNGYKPGAAPISYVFAKRQYALMQNGFKKEEAYKRTQADMKAERAADVEAVQRMVKQASAMSGARPSFVSDDDVYSGLRYWQSMMQETPYSDWDLPARQGLDVFLRRELIGWNDDHVKFAQSAKDGTAGALQAEINRLRVTLFPETKTAEYPYPSDVVRTPDHANSDEEDTTAAAVDGEDEEGGDQGADEGVEEWKAALRGGSWEDTLRRFRAMTDETPYELDWSIEDRQHLNAFIMGRSVRRAVIEETLAWIPDTVADAIARIDEVTAPTSPSSPSPSSAETSKTGKGGEGLGDPATPDEGDGHRGGGAVAEETVQEVGENWVEGGEALEGFNGDWMAIAKWRAGRQKTDLASRVEAAAGSRRKGKRGGSAVGAHSAALVANVKAVMTQAKRQLLPDLVLEVDEMAGEMSVEERKAKIAAKKKLVMADLEWENEEVDAERDSVINELRTGMAPPQEDPLAEVRKKRLAKGTWKAERRRLLKLEKELYEKQKSGMYSEERREEEPEDGAVVPEQVFESEIIRVRANELYAKEKARMKRNAKLLADAAAAGKELKRKAKEKAAAAASRQG